GEQQPVCHPLFVGGPEALPRRCRWDAAVRRRSGRGHRGQGAARKARSGASGTGGLRRARGARRLEGTVRGRAVTAARCGARLKGKASLSCPSGGQPVRRQL
ncbi:unnamed protein product, partial [Coccothraustes coccothraustes]